jgi:small conductance mechanosensitive channel
METTDFNHMIGIVQLFLESTIAFGIKLVTGIIILLIGLWLGNKITNSFRKIMVSRKVDQSLLSFLASLASIMLKILVVIIVLTTVGVEMTSIIAVLGAASLAIGMALSGTLQNFAGGVVILLFKPFQVDDFIETEKGYAGTVLEILIFTTRLKTADNKIIYLPNGSLANGVITNYNQEGTRRIDCSYTISYGSDLDTIRKVIVNLLNKDVRIIKNPEPVVFLQTLEDSSVKITVRFWVHTPDLHPVQCDLNEQIYIEFNKRGLPFPFPTMRIHIENNTHNTESNGKSEKIV